MKTCIHYLLILLSCPAFAQQKDSVRPKIPFFIVKFSNGVNNITGANRFHSDWNRITPGFSVPDSFSETHFASHPREKDRVAAFVNDFYYLLSFSFINNPEKQVGKKYRSMTTVHLGYGPQFRESKRWVRDDAQIIDTLTSSQNGNSFEVWRNRRQELVQSYRSQSVFLGIGEHFSTDLGRIVQFETGVDMLYVMRFLSEIGVRYSDKYVLTNAPEGYVYNGQQPVTNPSSGKYRSKLASGMIIRVPLDLSFRLCQKDPVWSRMRIGAEVNPGVVVSFNDRLMTAALNVSGGINFRFQF